MTDKPRSADINEYRRWLYRNSPRYRLSRLNHTRRQHGRDQLSSVDQAKSMVQPA
jgi:hypothetical protein